MHIPHAHYYCCRLTEEEEGSPALIACLNSRAKGAVTKILEQGQKWNGVPIFSCKIWHGQENNGMTIDVA